MKRGQSTVLGLIMVFIMLVFFIGMMPGLTNVINDGLAIGDDTTDLILSLMIPMIALGILYSFWMYIVPHREEPRY